jgi:hypothetical protein
MTASVTDHYSNIEFITFVQHRRRWSPIRDRLKMVVAARSGLIQAWDVDPREQRPDGQDRPQDEAVSD